MPEEKNNVRNEPAGEEAAPAEEIQQQSGNFAAEAEQLEHDIDALRLEAEENRDRLLRLAAEFENYKKRMTREREVLLKYAGENILRELLTTVDNLDRAIEQATADSDNPRQKLDSMLEGVELTRKGLLATMEKFDVTPIDSIGKKFDPNVQEAMAMESSAEVRENHVLREFVKGYRFKDRLLRPAKVVVSSGC
ncbi:MAG: nucleotide exchange factor GrpE [Desulfobulbaceae bacterium]|nr:nucleotide exchange factor GrpE [Desulfobulbaceae bacterium]